jgi:simple sugar transport system permease protein
MSAERPTISGRRVPEAAVRLGWPALALGLLLAFNLAFTPGFFEVELREGRLYGTLVDILNHGSKVGIVAIGMTLVIATGGVDLSVGAVMAISGAVAAVMTVQRSAPFPVILAAALGSGVAAGLFSGVLVSRVRIQPIVATLVLMVAGRGIAQLITGGLIITFNDPRLGYFAGGSLLGLPFPVALATVVTLAAALLTRRTAMGLFIEAVGDSERASRFSGLDSRGIMLLVDTLSGLCAALAGLIDASYIKAADANNAGLFV